MEYRQGLAYPLLGYNILANPDAPHLAVFELQTEAGSSLYLATREILEELSRAFADQAARLSPSPSY